jgi:ABC-2 type transport system ATP-binding protein
MIETRDLTKVYGDLYALDRLTLKLDKGDVYGFIGPNGAGKTTTMRILATLLNPSWGEATVCGYSIYRDPRDIRRVIGFMPDLFGVYDDMKVIEYLEFFAAAYRIDGAARQKKCEEVLELVRLGFKRDALAINLSRGLTQRLGLARVLLHDPQVLLLDEPASGLDPMARIEMRNLLKDLRSMGKTILISSHILPELADICNKIGIIDHGKLIFNGDVASAIEQVRGQRVCKVHVAGGRNVEAAALLRQQSAVAEASATHADATVTVTLADGAQDVSLLADVLVQAGFKLRMLREEEINLEDVFLRITKKAGATKEGHEPALP